MSYPLTPRERCLHKAFTLIELLTVIAIIGVLAAITFGVSTGVRERAAISQARSELSALAVALDSYKKQFGDYPQLGRYSTNTPPTTAADDNIPGRLFNALGGKLGPKRDPINGRASLELSKFKLLEPDLPALTGALQVANAILDPWGRPYIYSYRSGPSDAAWLNPSFVLLSAGPDGRLDIPVNGIIDNTDDDNLDNVYAN